MTDYPKHVNGEPPLITLKEYDKASWAAKTCVDRREEGYVIVVMENPDQVVAKIDKKDEEVLGRIYNSAHQNYADQLIQEKLQKEASSEESR